MSRGLSGALEGLFAENHISTVILVKLEFDSGTQRYFSGSGTLSYLGEDYLGTGEFGRMEPVLEDKGVKMKGIRLALQGVDTTVIDLTLNEAIQGRPASVSICSYDIELAAITEGFEIFSGYMDTIEMSRGSNASMVITIESIMSQFDLPNVRRFTSEDHKERYPTDSFFDFMPKTSEATIDWGSNTSGGQINGGSTGNSDAERDAGNGGPRSRH